MNNPVSTIIIGEYNETLIQGILELHPDDFFLLYEGVFNQFISQLNLLEILNLENNKIVEFPDSILSIKSLKSLILRKNPCFDKVKNEYSGRIVIS